MRRRTRTVIAALALAASASTLAACGGRTDGGNPGNPAGDVTTTLPGENTTTVPSG
jgi:hypothetical protein